LALWIGFIVWFVFNRAAFAKDEWLTGRRMAWCLCVLTFMIGAIGIGMLSSIPGTFLLLMCVGWTAVRPERVTAASRTSPARPVAMPMPMGVRAY
jgi:hypothetical protein